MTETATPHRPEDPAAHAAESHDGHPSPREYIKIAIILAIVTAAEVALFYVEGVPDPVVIALLMGMMVVKFAMVALWFMHLKFDSPIFKRFFIIGLVLAVSVYGIVLVTFGVFIN